MRKWLNEEFYNTVFTEEEKKAVKETTVVNEDSVWKDSDGYKHKVEGGNDTRIEYICYRRRKWRMLRMVLI